MLEDSYCVVMSVRSVLCQVVSLRVDTQTQTKSTSATDFNKKLTKIVWPILGFLYTMSKLLYGFECK